MRNLFHRILKALNINGRDWAVLLLALLLAFSIWLIHNLSLRYNDYLTVPVIAHCQLEGHADESSDRCEVIARCRATGYRMIRASLRRSRAVRISFKPSEMKHKEGDIFYVTSAEMQPYAHLLYGSEVTVEHFLSDTLFFRFPVRDYRKVPVIPIYSLTYRDQYMADGRLEVEPDSVLVYGEPFQIDNITAVRTKPVRYYDISENIGGVIEIDKIKGVRISEEEVRYRMDVKRFVEISVMLPVKTVNVPVDKDMLVYPSVVEVKLRCTFPLLDDPLQGTGIEADYNDFHKSLAGQCVLTPTGLPKGVISCEIEPLAVSCVIEER